jgi:hypothetical protein
VTQRTAKNITLCASAAMFAYAIGSYTEWMQSRWWLLIPLAFVGWMLYFSFMVPRHKSEPRP